MATILIRLEIDGDAASALDSATEMFGVCKVQEQINKAESGRDLRVTLVSIGLSEADWGGL